MTNKIISKPIKCFHFLSYTKSSSLQKKERENLYISTEIKKLGIINNNKITNMYINVSCI
jgi:hypothetical protein